MTYKHTYAYKCLNLIYNISILPECELPGFGHQSIYSISSASSTANPPVNDKNSPLIISDDEAEQEKGFDDSLMIVEDYEVTNVSTQSSASSTAKPPVNDKSSPLLISDDKSEQEKRF